MPEDHSACLQFPVDFDTKAVRGIPIGRILFGDFIGRLWLSPKGLKLYISASAVDEGFVILGERYDGDIELAGLPK